MMTRKTPRLPVATARGLVCVLACLALIAVAAGASAGARTDAPPAEAAGTETPAEAAGFRLEAVGLATPESVLYDPVADVYLVSNINGHFMTADDNGFISRVSPDGGLIALKWIDGAAGEVVLHAPKGMTIIADTLFVADLEAVRLFDRASGRPLGAIPIPEAKLPNDLVPAPGGGLYLSDNVGSSIWEISPDHAVTALARGAALQGPNGVAILGGELLFATSGGQTIFVWSAEAGPRPRWQVPKSGLDGLVVLADGSALVSSWTGSAVYRCDAGGEVREIAGGLQAPADIGFDAERSRLLIPLFRDDAVVVLPLAH